MMSAGTRQTDTSSANIIIHKKNFTHILKKSFRREASVFHMRKSIERLRVLEQFPGTPNKPHITDYERCHVMYWPQATSFRWWNGTFFNFNKNITFYCNSSKTRPNCLQGKPFL